MKHVTHCGWRRTAKAWLLALSGVVSFSAVLPHLAAQTESPAAATNRITIPLEYRETDNDIATVGGSFVSRSEAFRKEPPLEGRSVRRGSFHIGSRAGSATRFIWDYSQGRLHLDLNGNEDFTDDPDGVFTCPTQSRSDAYQRFAGIHLAASTNASAPPWLFDLTLNAFRNLNGWLALRSYWSGKAVLGEHEYELGVVPNLTGHSDWPRGGTLLLRPWSARAATFSTQDGSLDTFGCGTNLFFQGQAYRVAYGRPPENGAQRFEVELTAQETKAGEVRFTGQFIQRALLHEGPWTVVLDQPTGNMAVPLGTYAAHRVAVRQSNTVARLERDWSSPEGIRKPTVVEEGKTALVTTGGPLTNSVTVKRQGSMLSLQYRLIGAGGEAYQPLRQDRNEAPRLASPSSRETGSSRLANSSLVEVEPARTHGEYPSGHRPS